ncbi:MAG: DUF3575 domain-containing protein, partial [Bacteroidota bacterium]
LLFAFQLTAQENSSDTVKVKSNELKINGLYLVLGAFDITYERLLNEETGAGIDIFIPFDDEVNDDINFYLSPYYRFYFGKKHAAGFFVEGFGLLSSNNIERINPLTGFDPSIDNSIIEETTTDFALGIGIGGKWITDSGFVGELDLGIGRNLTNNEFNEDLIGKVSIVVGYRF